MSDRVLYLCECEGEVSWAPLCVHNDIERGVWIRGDVDQQCSRCGQLVKDINIDELLRKNEQLKDALEYVMAFAGEPLPTHRTKYEEAEARAWRLITDKEDGDD